MALLTAMGTQEYLLQSTIRLPSIAFWTATHQGQAAFGGD